MAAFTKDPLTFSLKRHEIDERLRAMPIPEGKRPPAANVDGMLKALDSFQKRNGIEILEWIDLQKTLYILEPAFLFYLRWRSERQGPPSNEETLLSLLETLSRDMKIDHIKFEFRVENAKTHNN